MLAATVGMMKRLENGNNMDSWVLHFAPGHPIQYITHSVTLLLSRLQTLCPRQLQG